MLRDRRLTVSVIVISLIVMPFLMGFIGNIDRMTGTSKQRIGVVVSTTDDEVMDVLSFIDNLPIFRQGVSVPEDVSTVTLIQEGSNFRIYGDGTDGEIRKAVDKITGALEGLKEKRIEFSLGMKGISPNVLHPFNVAFVDTASPERRSGVMLGVLIPYLAIILLVSNANRAMYVAVGEKEKNTLAALLVSNAPRHAIVLGKIMAITVFSVVSSLLLVVGMILFANFGFSLGGFPAESTYSLTSVQVLELLVNLAALALFIAAIIMLIGTFARSAREAGIYTTPILFIAIFLAVFSFSSTQFGYAAYAIPVLGNALSMRDTFLGELEVTPLMLSIGSNILFFSMLVVGAVKMYDRERILFRE